jgi:hypothetical protein
LAFKKQSRSYLDKAAREPVVSGLPNKTLAMFDDEDDDDDVIILDD